MSRTKGTPKKGVERQGKRKRRKPDNVPKVLDAVGAIFTRKAA